jgi:hypothetical protein
MSIRKNTIFETKRMVLSGRQVGDYIPYFAPFFPETSTQNGGFGMEQGMEHGVRFQVSEVGDLRSEVSELQADIFRITYKQ